jgi:hypothetical protein
MMTVVNFRSNLHHKDSSAKGRRGTHPYRTRRGTTDISPTAAELVQRRSLNSSARIH